MYFNEFSNEFVYFQLKHGFKRVTHKNLNLVEGAMKNAAKDTHKHPT
jgi:hypothetical protein